jgi:hypothetical protein
MTVSASLLRRLANLLVVFVFAFGLWATTAQAATAVHSVTGNARYQIGNGLPIPIGFTPAPVGRIKFPPGAVLSQTTGPDPKAIINPAGGVTHPGTPGVIGVFPQNSAVFQVYTALPLAGPKSTVTFVKSGRTGFKTVSWCPGQTVTPSGNPGCASAAAGPGINGMMRYTKTVAQFGGPNQGNVGGAANVALRVSGTPPGSVTAIFALATPFPTGAQGAPFGFKNSTAGGITLPPNGVGGFVANANGTLVGPPLWQHPTASGQPNPVTGYGAPWTTGMLTISVTANVGPSPEIFVMSGSDNRVGGAGTISLVTGSVSARALSGPNANRGWLNYTLGPPLFPGPVPAVSNGGLAAVFGLVALAGGYALWRRRS